jgi:EAL domain-containing protein (putative c-di-GMP-specific phosphodiesterase class I)
MTTLTAGDAIVDLVHDALAFGHFSVAAQPIVDLKTGQVEAEELLVRLTDAYGETLRPASFLPAAEQHGVIQWIDRYVFERAAELGARGRRVHVNVSSTTIADRDFLPDVIQIVRRNRCPPGHITFEITETAAARDMARARRVAIALRACGFDLALDDFGSGWGAFRYLKALPVSTIKIDREFVRDLPTSPHAVQVVRAIVGVARMLRKRTVAEGVEDAATLRLVRDLGIDAAQGFHLGRPYALEGDVSSSEAGEIAPLRYGSAGALHR